MPALEGARLRFDSAQRTEGRSLSVVEGWKIIIRRPRMALAHAYGIRSGPRRIGLPLTFANPLSMPSKMKL